MMSADLCELLAAASGECRRQLRVAGDVDVHLEGEKEHLAFLLDNADE